MLMMFFLCLNPQTMRVEVQCTRFSRASKKCSHKKLPKMHHYYTIKPDLPCLVRPPITATIFVTQKWWPLLTSDCCTEVFHVIKIQNWACLPRFYCRFNLKIFLVTSRVFFNFFGLRWAHKFNQPRALKGPKAALKAILQKKFMSLQFFLLNLSVYNIRKLLFLL